MSWVKTLSGSSANIHEKRLLGWNSDCKTAELTLHLRCRRSLAQFICSLLENLWVVRSPRLYCASSDKVKPFRTGDPIFGEVGHGEDNKGQCVTNGGEELE